MRSPRIKKWTLCVICGSKSYYNSKTCSEKCRKRRYCDKEMKRVKKKKHATPKGEGIADYSDDTDDEYAKQWQLEHLASKKTHE